MSSIEEDLRNSITSSTSYIPGEGEKVNDQKWRCFLLENFGETRDWLEKNVCMLVTLSLSFFHHFFAECGSSGTLLPSSLFFLFQIRKCPKAEFFEEQFSFEFQLFQKDFPPTIRCQLVSSLILCK